MQFLKAHGTGNDFIVLPDLAGELHLTDQVVARLCDRHFGIGADGILRVVRTAAAGEEVPGDCEFFMDYRNADGSKAQMCGNGARVFAQYLADTGLVATDTVEFATRGGVRTATFNANGEVTIDMGVATIGRSDSVAVSVDQRSWLATPVHVPNPHAVCFVDDLSQAGTLATAPTVEPAGAFPAGVNVEFVVTHAPDHVGMRVYERGSGATLSCGTGACAVGVVHAARTVATGESSTIRVDVPGGTVWVEVRPDGTVTLTGPTEFVASGEVDRRWLTRI